MPPLAAPCASRRSWSWSAICTCLTPPRKGRLLIRLLPRVVVCHDSSPRLPLVPCARSAPCGVLDSELSQSASEACTKEAVEQHTLTLMAWSHAISIPRSSCRPWMKSHASPKSAHRPHARLPELHHSLQTFYPSKPFHHSPSNRLPGQGAYLDILMDLVILCRIFQMISDQEDADHRSISQHGHDYCIDPPHPQQLYTRSTLGSSGQSGHDTIRPLRRAAVGLVLACGLGRAHAFHSAMPSTYPLRRGIVSG